MITIVIMFPVIFLNTLNSYVFELYSFVTIDYIVLHNNKLFYTITTNILPIDEPVKAETCRSSMFLKMFL